MLSCNAMAAANGITDDVASKTAEEVISDDGQLFGNLKDIDGFDPDVVVPGCFDFRRRTRSFDLHLLSHGGSKLKMLGRLFRSPSSEASKQQKQAASSTGCSEPQSPGSSAPGTVTSPRQSPPRRRRLVRVVRDVDPDVFGGDANPHVVHRFSDAFMRQKARRRNRAASESDCGNCYGDGRRLPYEVTGHTILKKPSLCHSASVNSCTGDDDDSPLSPPLTASNKHASFRDEVVVIEFDGKCRVVESTPVTRVVRLHDAVFDDADSYAACMRFEDLAIDETIAALLPSPTSSNGDDVIAPSPQQCDAAAADNVSAAAAADADTTSADVLASDAVETDDTRERVTNDAVPDDVVVAVVDDVAAAVVSENGGSLADGC